MSKHRTEEETPQIEDAPQTGPGPTLQSEVEAAQSALDTANDRLAQAGQDFAAAMALQDGPTVMEASRAVDAAAVAVNKAQGVVAKAENAIKYAEFTAATEARNAFMLGAANAIKDLFSQGAIETGVMADLHMVAISFSVTLDSEGRPLVSIPVARYEEGFAPKKSVSSGTRGNGGSRGSGGLTVTAGEYAGHYSSRGALWAVIKPGQKAGVEVINKYLALHNIPYTLDA